MALRCGFPPNHLNRRELEYFADCIASELDARAYIAIRNRICALWRRNITKFLSLDEALEDFTDTIRPVAAKVYNFLHRFGSINFGILKDLPLQ